MAQPMTLQPGRTGISGSLTRISPRTRMPSGASLPVGRLPCFRRRQPTAAQLISHQGLTATCGSLRLLGISDASPQASALAPGNMTAWDLRRLLAPSIPCCQWTTTDLLSELSSYKNVTFLANSCDLSPVCFECLQGYNT